MALLLTGGPVAAAAKDKLERFFPDDPRWERLFAVDPADEPLAPLDSEKTPFPAPTDAPRYTVTFKGEVAGFDVGRIFLDTTISRAAYDLDYRMEQNGIARFFSDAEATAKAAGVFDGRRIAGSYYHNFDYEAEDDQQRTEIFRAPGESRLRLWSEPVYWFEVPVPEKTALGATDPLGALVSLGFGEAAPGRHPCDRKAKVFDGRRRFDLTLSADGVERLEPRGSGRFEGEAYRCRVTLTKVAGYRPKDRAEFEGDLSVYLAPVPEEARSPTFAYVPVRVIARKGLIGASLEGKHPTIIMPDGERVRLFER